MAHHSLASPVPQLYEERRQEKNNTHSPYSSLIINIQKGH